MFTRLRDLREDHDLKQETLAAELGIRQTTYSKYELGKIAVPASALIRIADFYHVSLDYLVGRDAGPAKAEPVRPGLYRHFKGKEYRVLYNAAHSETLEPLVVYQALYGGAGRLGTPRLHVERTRGTGRLFGPRFTYLGE
ncbi:MAG: DUF1653 domain-containing protein [Intestinimonas sp.]